MIIRSKDKINVNGKNIPVWVLDTDALTVTHSTPDAEDNIQFRSYQVSSALFGGIPSCKAKKSRQ